MPEPEFEERDTPRGKLIVCRIGEYEGAARVFSAGEEEARQRALAQATAQYEAASQP